MVAGCFSRGIADIILRKATEENNAKNERLKAKNVKRIEDENQKTLRIWAQSYEKAHKPIENFNHKPLKLEKTDLIEILEILNKSGNDKTEKFNTDDFSKIIDEITQYLNKNNER